jgi:hypothetical protein
VLDNGEGLGKEQAHELVGALEARVGRHGVQHRVLGRHEVVDFVAGIDDDGFHGPQQVAQPVRPVAAAQVGVVVDLVGHEVLAQKQDGVVEQALVSEVVAV